MPQTFYIESDEEIISVIGRLRKSGAEENYFVFPKRALVLQSIVNLRLFQREAQKIGKKIIVVSQDEVGRMLAEKAGIETENYSEDFSKASTHVELSGPSVEEKNDIASSSSDRPAESLLRSDMIGSVDFHASRRDIPDISMAVPAPFIGQKKVSEPQQLRIRNASPEKSPSLNSKRYSDDFSSKQAREKFVPVVSTSVAEPSRPVVSANPPARDERLKNFFSSATPSQTQIASRPVVPKPQVDSQIPVAGKKASMIFLLLGGVSLISLIGVVLFLFLPKAEVVVTPHKMTQNIDLQFDGYTGSVAPSEGAIAVRLAEREETVSFTSSVTGKSGGLNQKARGTVVLYNNFSTEPQPLVATTRLESSDGKLFRLSESVTVPGMVTSLGKNESGAIEAKIIADQSGEEYNIDATTFTIPGFKGGPKYEKFSAKSTKTFSGGGSGGSDISVIIKSDLDKAENDAKEVAKKNFLGTLRSTLLSGEQILEEAIEATPIAPASLPGLGTAASSFEYTNTFKIRAFIFSEKDIKDKTEATHTKKIQEILFKPIATSFTYDGSLPNYNDGTVRIRAHAVVVSESDVNQIELKAALLGQNEGGIQNVLDGFPGVKKIEVNFDPEWFVTSIPKSENRVSIMVQPGEE